MFNCHSPWETISWTLTCTSICLLGENMMNEQCCTYRCISLTFLTRFGLRFHLISTHWSSNKMATIFRWHFKCIFYEYYHILIQISLKFVPKGPVRNKPVLVQVRAWCQTCDRSLHHNGSRFCPWLLWKGSGDGLALNRWQAITRTNFDQNILCHMVSLSHWG